LLEKKGVLDRIRFMEKLKILQDLQKKSQEAIRRAQSSHDDEG